jgi:putative endopeptidase
MPPRWKTCTRAVDRNLGEALGQEFVRRTFTADTKAKTQLMTEQIETAMQHEIENLDWMSPATKAEALRKLHAIRNKIGYPEKWRDYSALEVKPGRLHWQCVRAYRFEDARRGTSLASLSTANEWGMTPPTVNAYFNPQMNDINFPCRGSAAAALRSQGRRRTQLRQYRRHHRPRADACLRRRGPEVRRQGKFARLVDAGGCEGL